MRAVFAEWFDSLARKRAAAKLVAVLQQVVERLRTSRPSDWAALTPDETVAILEREIASLSDHRCLVNGTQLSSLFAPTASIQEISMAGGWADEYIELSTGFDAAFERLSRLR